MAQRWINSNVTPSQYTCLEVDAEAIEAWTTIQYPEANWVHHNAFNNVYNVDGHR